MSAYSYDKNNVNIDRLIIEINDSSIAPELDYINFTAPHNGDDGEVEVYFVSDLSGAEITILDGIISNHTGEELPPEPEQLQTPGTPSSYVPVADGSGGVEWQPLREYSFCIQIMDTSSSSDSISIESKSWTVCSTFIFKGTDISYVDLFKICACTDRSSGCGYIRLYDYTNRIEICSLEVRGNEKKIYSTEKLTTLSTDESIIELQGRRSSGKLKLFYSTLY